MRALLAVIFALAAFGATAQIMMSHPLRGIQTNTLLVAGSSPPTLGLGVNGAGGEHGTPTWAPIIQPAQQGSPGTGYSDDATAVWDSIPFAVHGINGVEASHNFSLCVLADQISGIAKVTFYLDGGAGLDVTTLSTTPGHSQGYCAPASDLGMNDGLHEARAVVYPINGYPKAMQSVSYVTLDSANSKMAAANHGQPKGVAAKIFTVLNADGHAPSTDATFAPGTSWCLLSSSTTAYDGEHFQAAALTGWPSSGFSCSATATAPASNVTIPIVWYGAGGHEQNYSMGESLFFLTNANGTLPSRKVYADVLGGNDANVCSQASPCKTLHGAKEQLVSTESGVAQTVGSASGCTTFTKAGNTSGAKPFHVGDAVVFEATVGDGASHIINDQQTYFVQSAAADVLTIAATPAGACLSDNLTGSGTVDLASDLSLETVYMVCNAGLGCGNSTPALYQWGVNAETARYATFGYLNVLPDPATATISNTAINGAQQGNASPGGFVQRAHITAQVNPGLVDNNGYLYKVTTSTVGSANSAGATSLTVDSIPTYVVANAFLLTEDSATGCFPITNGSQSFVIGSAASIQVRVSATSAGPPATISFSQSGNGLTGSAQVFNGCPAGTNFYISAGAVQFNLWQPHGLTKVNSYLWGGQWLDGVVWNIPSPFTGGAFIGPGGNSLAATLSGTAGVEGLYETGISGPGTSLFSSATLVENSTSAYNGGACANNVQVILNSSCTYVDLYLPGTNDPGGYQLASNAGSGASTLTFTGPLPTWINVGWGMKQYGSTRCLNQTAGSGSPNPNATNAMPISAYNKVTNTVTINPTYGAVNSSGCTSGPSGNLFTFYDNGHADVLFWNSNGSASNNIFVDNFTCNYCYAEGFFTQQTMKMNIVARNSSMQTMIFDSGGLAAVLLSSVGNTNHLYKNDIFNVGLTPPTGAFYTAVASFAGGPWSDVYFINDTCPAGQPITNYSGGLPAGITVNNTGGGNC